MNVPAQLVFSGLNVTDIVDFLFQVYHLALVSVLSLSVVIYKDFLILRNIAYLRFLQ